MMKDDFKKKYHDATVRGIGILAHDAASRVIRGEVDRVEYWNMTDEEQVMMREHMLKNYDGIPFSFVNEGKPKS